MTDWTRQPDPATDADFFKALDVVEKFEGGYADDPADPGGATKWGVTQGTYNTFRDAMTLPRQPVLQMSDEACTAIYFCEFWVGAQCDRLTYPFALCHFDAVVNMAPYWWKQCKAAAMGDSKTYLDKREWCYQQIVTKRPASLKFLTGWDARVEKLRAVVSQAQNT